MLVALGERDVAERRAGRLVHTMRDRPWRIPASSARAIERATNWLGLAVVRLTGASGSTQVVTKVARLRAGSPSRARSSATSRMASTAVIPVSGNSRLGTSWVTERLPKRHRVVADAGRLGSWLLLFNSRQPDSCLGRCASSALGRVFDGRLMSLRSILPRSRRRRFLRVDVG